MASVLESPSQAGDRDMRGDGKYRLMLVDDEDSLRRAVSEYLEQASDP